jgi:hypothetical protein
VMVRESLSLPYNGDELRSVDVCEGVGVAASLAAWDVMAFGCLGETWVGLDTGGDRGWAI